MSMFEALRFVEDLKNDDEMQKAFVVAMHETDPEMNSHINAARAAMEATVARNTAAFVQTRGYELTEEELRFYINMVVSGLFNQSMGDLSEKFAAYAEKMGMSPDNFRRPEPEDPSQE